MITKLLAGGGLAAALAASTCCVLPLSLGAVGAGGAWLSTLSVLAPYQTGFSVLAIVLLGAAFWMVYAPRPATAGADACAAAPSQRTTKTALWLGALVTATVLTSGFWTQLVA
jgi:mercuric ion transport protein